MNQTKFVISRFENRNGVPSWRVSGWLSGERIRKNFKTREEAAAEKATLEIKAEQASSGLRSIATSLTVDQVRDAEAAIRRLKEQVHSLAFCVEYTLTNYRAPARLCTDLSERGAVHQIWPDAVEGDGGAKPAFVQSFPVRHPEEQMTDHFGGHRLRLLLDIEWFVEKRFGGCICGWSIHARRDYTRFVFGNSVTAGVESAVIFLQVPGWMEHCR